MRWHSWVPQLTGADILGSEGRGKSLSADELQHKQCNRFGGMHVLIGAVIKRRRQVVHFTYASLN